MMTKQQGQRQRAVIAEILRVTQKTKTEFAGDIGVAAGVVRQWTMAKPREVPPEYRQRIAAFYGAAWDDSSKVSVAGDNKRRRFTRKSFENWRTLLTFRHRHRLGFPRIRRTNGKPWLDPKGQPFNKYGIEGFLTGRSVDVLCRTLAAAEGRGVESNSRRFFAVVESFLRWSQGIIEDFKLSDSKEIQDVYRVTKGSGVIESTGRLKYISMFSSVTKKPSGLHWRWKTNKNGGNVVIENGKRAFEYV
jgi:hypothetical protein